ncbi:MAG TPA: caspase family protein [Polyangia bacterium]|nr:caspase family protein [Polyangia bacterium]
MLTTNGIDDHGRLAALVVGISDYGATAVRLPGCEEDARSWRDLAVQTYGAAEGDVRVLLDRRASRADVLEGLRWLLGRGATCSRLLFCFAGHGTLVERPSPSRPEEGAVFDEALICYPSAAADPAAAYLFDDDVSLVVGQAGTGASAARLTLVIDACHAGGFEREAPAGAAIARFRPAAGNAAGPRVAAAGVKLRRFGTLAAAPPDRPTGRAQPVLVAAARSNQSAYDDRMDDGRHHGVFSFHATALLRADRGLSYRALVARVARELERQFDQVPQLEGDSSRIGRAFTE